METSGIYMIKNKINGKVYIGQSVDIKKRWSSHIRNLESGTHDNFTLQCDYNKCKLEGFQFEVLKELINPTQEELLVLETQYINKFNSTIHGYNKAIFVNTNPNLKKMQIETDIVEKDEWGVMTKEKSKNVQYTKVIVFIKKLEKQGYKIRNYNKIFSVFRDNGIFKYIDFLNKKQNIAVDTYVSMGYFINLIEEKMINDIKTSAYKIFITKDGEDFMMRKLIEYNLFSETPDNNIGTN